MRHKRGFYEVAPVAGFIARQDWTHMMERAERNGLSLQSQKGSTGLLFSVRILAPILDGELRHIVLAAIHYSLGRHTYMPSVTVEFTCRNLNRLDEATRSAAVAAISAGCSHLARPKKSIGGRKGCRFYNLWKAWNASHARHWQMTWTPCWKG